MQLRRVLAVALSLTAAVGGLLVVRTANAQVVTTGSLSFSGDAGDYISGGKSYSYSTSKGDALDVSSSSGSTLSVRVNAYNGDWWTLDLDAPGTPDRPVPGQSAILAPGTYSAAHRYPFNGNGPGLDLSGDGRGCNELTGSFTVTRAVFSGGYVQTFDATFEQHCEGGTPAARGEIHISNPAAPPQAASPTKGAATTNPRATPITPRATSASGSGAVAGTASSSGNTNANDVGANTPATPRVVRDAFRTPILAMEVGLVAWVILVVVGLATVGIVLAVRRR
jgi:hypothetical protein